MERKFKVGDRVKDKITGISCDVVYVHEDSGWPFLIVGKTANGVCVNWRRLEQIELIPPPQKLPEPKFNPYDKVRVNIKNFTPFNAEVTAWFICGDHYIYELKTEYGGTFQSKGEGVELIEPKYKKGDRVWNKITKSIGEFFDYHDKDPKRFCFAKYNDNICTNILLGIEPYTGQDKEEETISPEKAKELINEMRNQPLRIVPLHPYTVILKSGVKVGVTAEAKGELVEGIDSLEGEDLEVFNAATLTSKECSFCVIEIAAIVPTENIVK